MKVDSREQIASMLLNEHLVENQEQAVEAGRNLLGLCSVCCEIALDALDESDHEENR